MSSGTEPRVPALGEPGASVGARVPSANDAGPETVLEATPRTSPRRALGLIAERVIHDAQTRLLLLYAESGAMRVEEVEVSAGDGWAGALGPPSRTKARSNHADEIVVAPEAVRLRRRALESAAYLLVREGLGLVIKLGGLLALIRLIGPRAYGLYAAPAAVVTFGAAVSQVGIEMYLVRHRALTRRVLDACTGLLLATSALATLVLSAFALAMPRLLGAHDEAFVALVLALSLPLNVLWVPAQAMLERSLRFRAVAGLEVGSDVAFYAVALALAATGLGVWAPVGANLAWQTMRLIGSYALAGTVPRPRWSAAEALAAVRFGIPASMPRWRQSAASALVAMVVGAELGAHAVGVVMVAWRAVAALALAARATWRVALATLARIGDDTARLAGAVADAMVLELVALAVPLVVLVWCAGPLVRGLLGAPWAGVARAVPWIAVAALLDATLVVGTAALVVAASPVVVGVGQLVGFGVLAAASAAAVGGLGIAGAGVGYLGGVLATTLPYALARRRIGVRPRTLVPAAECYAAAVPALVASLVHAPWRFALLATLPLPALEPRVRRVVGEAASVAWSLMRLGRRRERLASSNPRSRRVARRVAVGSAITALALLVALLGPLGVPGTQPSGANRGASPIKAGDPPSMRGSHPRTHPRVGPASTTLPALGVYTGPGAARAAASWASSLGVPVVLATDYVEDTTWSTIANPAWQLGAWRTAGFAMTWGIPLLPATGGASLSAAAAGAYDAVFAHLARLLVAYGQGGATLVLGWDPDAPDLPWSVANDQQAAEYRGAWRQVVRTMRAVAGAHFAFEWDMAPAGWPVEPTALWPGDDYVDVVATDVFDTAFDGDPFPVLEGGPFGLDWFAEFAQAHDKPLALAKWGVSAWTTDDTSSAAFVSELVDWAHANHVVAAIAWAQGSWALAPSRTPQAFAALRQAVARLG